MVSTKAGQYQASNGARRVLPYVTHGVLVIHGVLMHEKARQERLFSTATPDGAAWVIITGSTRAAPNTALQHDAPRRGDFGRLCYPEGVPIYGRYRGRRRAG